MPDWKPLESRNPDIPKDRKTKLLPLGEEVVQGIFRAHNLNWTRESEIGDRFGKYGYTGRATNSDGVVMRFVLIAREYIYGKIVGAGGDIMGIAQRENRQLLMYISTSNAAYVFEPSEVMKVATTSFRHGMNLFYDFPITMGKNLVGYLDTLFDQKGQFDWSQINKR